MLIGASLLNGVMAEPLASTSPKKFKFEFEATLDSGPIDKDSTVPAEKIEISRRVYDLYRNGELSQGLKEMTPLMAWVDANFARFTASRARSNLWMGILYHALGVTDKAIFHLSESSEILAKLAATNPPEQIKLVYQITLLSELYAESGQYQSAFDAQEKAVRISRELAGSATDSVFAQFMALQGLANRYVDLNREEESLAIRREATSMMRSRIQDNSSIARVLIFNEYMLWNQYYMLNRHQDALSTANQIAASCREIGKVVTPASRSPDLAFCYSILGLILMSSGNWGDSLASFEKAIEIDRMLVAKDPEYLSELARNLVNASAANQHLGRVSRAQLLAEEAVNILRKLEGQKAGASSHFDYKKRMDDYIPALKFLGGLQFSTGQLEQARATFDELQSILTPLVPGAPRHRETLLEVLNTVDELNRKEGIEKGTTRVLPTADLSFLPRNDPANPLKRAVVRLWSTFGGKKVGVGLLGTGFVVQREGDRAWIATALHVVRNPEDYGVATRVEAELFTGPLPPGLVPPRLEVLIRQASTLPRSGDEPILLEVRGLPPDIKPLPLATTPAQGVLTIVGHPNKSGPWTVLRYPLLTSSEQALLLEGKLDKGASGSPVLSASQQVVGVVYDSPEVSNIRPIAQVWAFPVKSLVEKIRLWGSSNAP